MQISLSGVSQNSFRTVIESQKWNDRKLQKMFDSLGDHLVTVLTRSKSLKDAFKLWAFPSVLSLQLASLWGILHSLWQWMAATFPSLAVSGIRFSSCFRQKFHEEAFPNEVGEWRNTDPWTSLWEAGVWSASLGWSLCSRYVLGGMDGLGSKKVLSSETGVSAAEPGILLYP